jgi:hypothetical protein
VLTTDAATTALLQAPRRSPTSGDRRTEQGAHHVTTIENGVRNGVDTASLFATLDAIKANPDIAKFQFRATNRWVSGTHNRSTASTARCRR